MTAARTVLSAVALLFVAVAVASAEEPAATLPDVVSFNRDIQPIFRQHCQGCHQPAKAQGGYVMTGHADLLKAADNGQVGVVPGKPQESELFRTIVPDGTKPPRMPKGDQKPLAERQVALIQRWIEQGAKDDTPKAERQRVDADHPPVYELQPVVTALEYSPDGKLIAVSGYHEVLLHKADGSGLAGRLVGLSERVQSLAFSPDGKLLAVAGGSPGRFGEVQIWDVEKKTLKLSHVIGFDTLYGVSWSPDGTKVAFGMPDNTLRAVEAETGKQVLFQGAHSDWVLDTVFSRDGAYVVSVSRDMSMKLTELATQRFIDNVTSITPGALKGGLLTVSRRPRSDNRMSVVPPDTPNEKPKPYDEVLAAGSDGTPRLYKIHREAKRVIGDDFNKIREYAALPGRIYASAFNPDGNRFVVGSSLNGKGEVRIFQTDDGKQVATLEGQKGAVYALAYRPDGKQVASAGFDGMIRLHDADTGKLQLEIIVAPVTVSPTTQTSTKSSK